MAQENVGAFMQKMRREKGMTQKELADILHISDKTISKWETGKGIPDVSYLENICTALDVTINELLSGQKLPPEEYPPKAEDNMLYSFCRKITRPKSKTECLCSWAAFYWYWAWLDFFRYRDPI